MRYTVADSQGKMYEANILLVCNGTIKDNARNCTVYPLNKDFLIPTIYSEYHKGKPISVHLANIETGQKEGIIKLGDSDEEKLIALCLPTWYKIYVGERFWSKVVKRKVDKDTGEVTEEYETPEEQAVNAHWDFSHQVKFLVEHKKAEILYGETAEDLGVSQEAYSEAIKQLLGDRTYKDPNWRDFLK